MRSMERMAKTIIRTEMGARYKVYRGVLEEALRSFCSNGLGSVGDWLRKCMSNFRVVRDMA